ncbi:MAG: hypothetical protein JZD40_04740 [Sulfolobus sp.]|nr:hypothetical protein [Sulfolobus sp.]
MEYLTPLALAIWIMDDGWYENGGIYLHVNSILTRMLLD